MTAEFGPLDDEHETDGGVTAWLAGRMIRGTARLYTYFMDDAVRYAPERNRLSLHGDSGNPGDGFKCGVDATLIVVSSALLAATPVVVLGEFVEMLADTVFALPAVVALGGVGFASIFVIGDVLERLSSMEVYDHTTPKPDDRIDELADGYVDGELDREEFAAEVETVFEREAER